MVRFTPGVYIEEISTLPASIAAVETAIPAFIGYTKNIDKDIANDEKLKNLPIRVTSMLEFINIFGEAESENFTGSIEDIYDDSTNLNLLSRTFSTNITPIGYNLFYSIQLFFNNGGGPCYIVAIGKTTNSLTISDDDFKDGIIALEKVDEPTLLVFPDAINLPTTSKYTGVVDAALGHCKKLQDRFTIADVHKNIISLSDITAFRTALGNDGLNYGAIYHPFLQTGLNFKYDNSTLTIAHAAKDINGATITLPTNFNASNETQVNTLEASHPSIYRSIIAELNKSYVKLPPSPAVAGIYAKVDATRGVWKAPANVSLNSVIEPTIKITNTEQDYLNVDAGSGKSINAIRTFTGKGTLVWGARTLAGNDAEWRYVPVRRLYIFVEESIKKATEFVVFEPNDANTWLRVKTMIENFLTGLWREGALAGAKPEDAFFVNVGLGTTMIPDDILKGIMNVEVGMAAVRPAEFIILKFSHKLQES